MFLKCKERRNTVAQERETRIACPSLVYSAHQHPTPTVFLIVADRSSEAEYLVTNTLHPLYFSLLSTGALRRSI